MKVTPELSLERWVAREGHPQQGDGNVCRATRGKQWSLTWNFVQYWRSHAGVVGHEAEEATEG